MDFTSMNREALKDYATADDLLDIVEALRDGAMGDIEKPVKSEVPEGEPLTFMYTNWRGEIAKRRAIPMRTYWGSTDWHPEPQWLMEAFDTDKKAVRVFAMSDMSSYAKHMVEVNCPGVEKGRADIVGFHAGRPVVWTHSKMEYQAFDLSFITSVTKKGTDIV